jgi:L-fuconolactonase
VVVEASPWVEDNQWLLDLAAEDKLLVGIVGHLAPGGEKFAEHLKRFAKNPLYRGFRINGGGLTKNLEQPEFVAGLKRVIDHGLELDVNGGPSMLPGVAALAAKLPELRIVINHLANVKNDGKTVDADWLKGMQSCAAHKNVFCKVSALAESASNKDAAGLAPKETAYYAPLLDAVWKTWGDDRVIYGSNWPVSARAASYRDVLRVVAEYVGAKGKPAAEKFFAGNAKTAYRWVVRS